MEEEGEDIRTCVCWIPRGIPAAKSTVYEYAEPAEDASTAARSSAPTPASVVDLPAELRMDDYDNDDPCFNPSLLHGTDTDLLEADPLLDPTVLAQDEKEKEFQLVIDEKKDYAIVMGAVDCGEDCAFETLLYTPDEGATYHHHMHIAEAYPLSIVWLPIFKEKKRKHIVAVGSFLPVIEIFDNDVIDKMEPDAVLDSKAMHHTDAIPALSLNPKQENLLLSASHDRSVIVWDTRTLVPLKKYDDLTAGKIAAAEWSPCGKFFAVGAEGKENVAVVNAKTSQKIQFTLGEDVEGLTWVSPTAFAVVTTEGSLFVLEAATSDTWAIKTVSETTVADGPVLAVCKLEESKLLVVTSEEGIAYVYDYADLLSLKKVHEKQMNVGPMFDVKPSPDLKSVVALAGNEPVVWDLAYEVVLTPWLEKYKI